MDSSDLDKVWSLRHKNLAYLSYETDAITQLLTETEADSNKEGAPLHVYPFRH